MTGRTVIVTGAARGMGRAVAERCAADGARLVLADFDPAVQDVAAALGATAIVGDVTDPATARAAVAVHDDLYGLANVAGVHQNATVADVTDEDWARVLAVNLTAPMVWAREAIPVMVASGGGAIVNIASLVGTRARPRSAAYVTSKTGLLGLTRSIAVDFGRQGIRCNAISPGSIDTPMLRAAAERDPAGMQAQIDAAYAGRIGTPQEIAAACAFLLSDECGFVNGVDLPVDGARAVGT
jgi:NAD(P)-dependent dehydrogenase (short-subunit alcohol dehydrogenase family)